MQIERMVLDFAGPGSSLQKHDIRYPGLHARQAGSFLFSKKGPGAFLVVSKDKLGSYTSALISDTSKEPNTALGIHLCLLLDLFADATFITLAYICRAMS